MATQITNKPKAGALHAGVEQSTNKRCPAIILAASRTAKVIGRIKELIISIHTMNGTNATAGANGSVLKTDGLYVGDVAINETEIASRVNASGKTSKSRVDQG